MTITASLLVGMTSGCNSTTTVTNLSSPDPTTSYTPVTPAAPVVPWVDTADGNWSTATAQATVLGKSLHVSTQISISTDTDLSSIPEIVVIQGGGFNVSEGVTLTLPANFHAGRSQCFSGTGAVRGLKQVEDSWFPTAQAGLNAAAGGVYRISQNRTETTPWVVPKYTTITGTGKAGVKVTWTHTGDGIQSTWPINSSTGAYITIKDLWLRNTNSANTGGGFVDVGGSFVVVQNSIIQGFKYGVILDQTELSEIDLCDFEGQLLSPLWIVNGSDHTAGAQGGFTNRISVTRNQFGGAYGVGYGVIDDGGNTHTFRDNNFNGFISHARFAGVSGLHISGGEYESASSDLISFQATSFKTGAGVGQCIAVEIGGGAEFVPAAGSNAHCISIGSLGTLNLNGVFLGNSTATKIAGASNAAYIFAANLYNGGGGETFDGKATVHRDLSASAVLFDNLSLTGRLQQKIVSLAYGPTVSLDASTGNFFTLVATNTAPFTIANPTNPVPGQEITIAIYNNSGGTMGPVTWGSAANFRIAGSSWTNPAPGNIRTITLRYVTVNWIETARSVADVPQ